MYGLTFSPLQPPHQLESLDDLIAQAEHYAEFCMRNSGKMSPTLFLIGADGPLMFVPTSLTDENEKDAFATAARLMCIAHAATVCVMAMEAWMNTAKPGEKLDMTEPPSEAFDRQEVVVLMGEDRTGQKQKFLPIIRSGNGKFFGFNESDMPQLDSMEGRFAGILPPNVATDEHRTLAKAMLKVKGVNVTKSGTTVRLIRPGADFPSMFIFGLDSQCPPTLTYWSNEIEKFVLAGPDRRGDHRHLWGRPSRKKTRRQNRTHRGHSA